MSPRMPTSSCVASTSSCFVVRSASTWSRAADMSVFAKHSAHDGVSLDNLAQTGLCAGGQPSGADRQI